MKGSILFNKDINIEVDVDPSAEEGARLISAKNLVDGQEAGGGGGTYSSVHVTFEFTDVGNGQPVIVDWIGELYGSIILNPSNPEWEYMGLNINMGFEPATTTPVIEIPFIEGKKLQLILSNLNGATDIGGEFFIDHENPVITVSGNGSVVDLSQGLVEVTGDCTIHANTMYD